ncbi:MAG TPA: FliM/FliN family flagellar motor switch protein [Bryobacteraceae bacterium]
MTVELLAPFFEEWMKEFSRAVEMFAGERAEVKAAAAGSEDAAAETLASLLWWKQPFEGEGTFSVWVGVPEGTWRTLGSAMAANPEQAREAFLEMLGQAQQGTAAVASAGLTQPVRCRNAEETEAPRLESLAVRRIEVEFRGAALPPLLVALEPEAASIIGLDSGLNAGAEAVRAPGTKALRAPETDGSPEMLDCLLEVNLPLSVALGRAVMPVRDILKMTPGALVELDRDIGEYVEILVHGTVVARGEVVSVKGNYGVRIKEIISREERLALRANS